MMVLNQTTGLQSPTEDIYWHSFQFRGEKFFLGRQTQSPACLLEGPVVGGTAKRHENSLPSVFGKHEAIAELKQQNCKDVLKQYCCLKSTENKRYP